MRKLQAETRMASISLRWINVHNHVSTVVNTGHKIWLERSDRPRVARAKLPHRSRKTKGFAPAQKRNFVAWFPIKVFKSFRNF